MKLKTLKDLYVDQLTDLAVSVINVEAVSPASSK